MSPEPRQSRETPASWVAPAVFLSALLVIVSLPLKSERGSTPIRSFGPVGSIPKSVILLVGDGLGPQEIGLYLDVQDALGEGETALGKAIASGRLSVLRTGSANSTVTDSAAAATEMATGVSTSNGRIGLDREGNSVRSCLEDARDSGRMTALVTTTRLTHATPASFVAHVASRDDELTIARQMISSGVDVLLGGGSKYFLGGLGGQSLGAEISAEGYQLVRTASELRAAPTEGRLLGLFAASDLPYRVDRDGDLGEPQQVPGLPQLTESALDRLDPQRGFFLMIEGGRIDHAGHQNDVGAMYGELQEFDATIELLLDYVDQHSDVALIITADHETGGLSLTYRAGGVTPTVTDLQGIAAAKFSMASKKPAEPPVIDGEAIFGSARVEFVPATTWSVNAPALQRSAGHLVSFATQGHTATPILVLHHGAGEDLPGLTRHTEIGQRLRSWLSSPLERE